jgi:hypothetical protein
MCTLLTRGNPQFSRYITTPSTTVATSSADLEPPLAPPPPPPPLNIPPSRARRQLAARLALHKQNADNSTNGGEHDTEKAEHRQNINPFATEEDDDEDDQEDFTIGDLEVEAEGKGMLPPGSALTGQQATLDELVLQDLEGDLPNDHVGIINSKSDPNDSTRASFPSMWPFGHVQRLGREHDRDAQDRFHVDGEEGFDRSHSTGADDSQSSDDSTSDEDEDSFGAGIRGDKKTGNGKRRRPSTTEAKRRTSLEDDDEDEGDVVHVGKERDDEDLVEIQHHSAMQGLEGPNSHTS